MDIKPTSMLLVYSNVEKFNKISYEIMKKNVLYEYSVAWKDVIIIVL